MGSALGFLLLKLIFCIAYIPGDKVVNSLNFEGHLRNKLFSNWSESMKQSIPTGDDDVVDVYFGMNISHIKYLDEFQQILTTNAILKLKWTNPSLQWNRTIYGDLEHISLSPDYMWVPDIVLKNSLSGTEMFTYGPSLARVYYNGTIEWNPQVSLRSTCSVVVRNFPFDEQMCTLVFGSWMTNVKFLMIYTHPENIDPSAVLQDTAKDFHEWTVTNGTFARKVYVYDCCPEERYVTVNVYLHLKRNSTFHVYTLIVPLVITMIIMLVLFWLPPSSGEKFIIGGINLVILVMLFNQLYWTIPRNASSLPVIVAVTGTTYFFTVLAILISIVTANLSMKSGNTSEFVERHLKGRLGSILYLPSIPEQMEDSTDSESNNYWYLVAVAIHRISFVIYLIIVIVLCALLPSLI